MIELVIYGKNPCPQCNSLKIELDYKEIPYTYLLLDKDYIMKELMDVKPNDVKSFPVPFIKRTGDNGITKMEYIAPNAINIMNEDIASLILSF